MFLRRRGILIGIGILALATVSLAATVQVYFFRLPDPSEADGPGIIRWMVTRDLSQESPDTRRRLLIRVLEVIDGQDLTADSGKGSIDDQLGPQYRDIFWKNVDTLLEEWFHMQAERYAAAHVSDQTALLDQILNDAQGLASFQKQDSKKTEGSENEPEQAQTAAGSSSEDKNAPETDSIAAAATFIQTINKWVDRAPPEKQKQLRHFAAALQARIAVKSFQGLMNSLKPDQPAAQP